MSEETAVYEVERGAEVEGEPHSWIGPRPVPQPVELYVMTDIETTGKAPGVHSMISLASVAITATGEECGWFNANLEELEGAGRDASTMRWWQGFPDSWAKSTKDPLPAKQVIEMYNRWLLGLPAPRGGLFMTAYPSNFDSAFVDYYLYHFLGRSPLSHGAICMKTLAMALLNRPYRSVYKKDWPARWKPATGTHAHTALEDAREQAHELVQMLKELKALHLGPAFSPVDPRALAYPTAPV